MEETQLTRPHLPNTALVRSHINSRRLETSSAFTALGPLFPDYSFTEMAFCLSLRPTPDITITTFNICLSLRQIITTTTSPSYDKADSFYYHSSLQTWFEIWKTFWYYKEDNCFVRSFFFPIFVLKKVGLESSPAWGSTAVKVVRPQLWWVTWCRLYPGTRKSPPPLTFWPTGAGSSSGEKIRQRTGQRERDGLSPIEVHFVRITG